ncbi:T-lymphocyte activation antigen CD80-like isoform X1 [Anguilla rostrata]|uniref:T-lymphocyte activation antigen CD80-like isoform X1 n=1 Tax=Anguilla rostrata TaxID=7938 RepID=UPI0030CF2A36
MFAVHGGISGVSLCIALLLVIPSVSPPVSPPSVVKGVFGASVTLPCDGSAYRGTPEAQLDVLWQTPEGKKVARYSRGDHSVGIHFEGRVTFPTERIRQGDFSIDISSVTFRDEDSYECVWKGPDERGLKDVRLYVLKPSIPNHLSVPVGDSVTLPCYGQINKEAPQKSFVQWKRGDELVLKYGLGEVTYGPKYDGRASVSSERIQKGDFSLSLSVTGVCDSGVYQCSTDQNQNVTSIVLELKDYRHYKSVSLSLGTPFSLSLPKEPVKVVFSKEGTLPKVPLCSVDTGGFKCEPKYRVWTEWKNLTVTSDDVGTYTVIYSWNCLISHAYGVNIKHDNNNYYWFFLLIPIVVIVVVCIVCIRILCVQRKRKKSDDLGHRSLESVSTFSQDDAADEQAHLTEDRSGQ